MSTYTAQYTRPYADGYKDRPDESTPEYARYINARDDALLRIEAFLAALNIPSKLSDLVNDEGFIKNTVSNLANYYLKSETYARTETYTQSEVQALIADAVSKVSGKLNISVVDTLPTSDISTTTFYLVPKETALEKNLYDEYINTDGTESGWELIGAVSTSADLSEYYKKSEVDTLLANKVNTSDLVASSFSGTKAVIGNQVSGGGGSALHVYSTEEKVVGTWIDGKTLYEKTIVAENESGFARSETIYQNDMENIISVEKVMLYNSVEGHWISERFTVYPLGLDWNDNTVNFRHDQVGYDGVIKKIRFTIQYTKTTDIPTT